MTLFQILYGVIVYNMTCTKSILTNTQHVLGVFLHRPLEEPLAALARPHAVVLARRVVAAHRAQQARPARLARAVAAAVGGG